MDLNQLLQNAGLAGWTPIGQPSPEMKQVTITAPTGATHSENQQTGRYFIVVSDGKGGTRKITLHPTGIDPTGSVSGWTVEDVGAVEQPPKPAATPDPKGGPLTDFQPIVGPNGATAKLYNPKTGQVIDLPDSPSTTARPQVVGSAESGYFAWDGSNLKPLTSGKPDKPQVIQGERGALYSWDGSNLTTVKQPDAKARDVAVVDNQLVDKNTGEVVYTAPQGVKFQTAQDGSILAIDPSNPSNVQTIWQPDKPASMVPGQSPGQKKFLFIDPKTGQLTSQDNPIAGDAAPQTSEVSGQPGPKILQKVLAPDGSVTYQSVDNPAYTPAGQQSLQEYLDGIKQIEGMIASGQMTVLDASRYKDLLKQQYESKLQGTTPYQMEQDRQAAQIQRMQSGQSLLNQRVSSGSSLASSLLNSAVGIAGNKNFMDPSAVAGLNIFGGAVSVPDFINRLGGGQGVMDAAGGAVQAGLTGQAPPQSVQALLAAALGAHAGDMSTQSVGGSAGGPLQPPSSHPSYGGSGAASNPQPPMPGLVSPLGRQPESAAASTARNQAAMDPNDPAMTFLRQALGGAM